MKSVAYAVAVLALLAGSALAQAPAPTGPNCLFPLACPGPVPPKPEPLLGPPDEAGAAAQPVEKARKAKHSVHKRAPKAKAQ